MFVLLTCLFFAVLVSLAATYAAFRFRRTAPGQVGDTVEGNMILEVGWTVIPLMIALVMFAWGAVVYVNFRTPPKDTLDIYVTGDRKSTRLNSSHLKLSRMPSSA